MIARAWHIFVWVGVRAYWLLLRPRSARVRGLVEHKGCILLVKHVGGRNRWTLPGGGGKPGETWEQALQREIKEELNLEIAVGQKLLVYPRYRLGARTTYHCFTAQARRDSLDINRKELRTAGWFSLDALPVDTSSFTLEAVYRYQNRANYHS